MHTTNEHLDALIPFSGYQIFFLYFFKFYSFLQIASTTVLVLMLCHSANEMSVHISK